MPVYGCAAGKHAYGRNDSCSKPGLFPDKAFHDIKVVMDCLTVAVGVVLSLCISW